MPWVAGLIGNADSDPDADPPEESQQTVFLNLAVLDGLNTLDDTEGYLMLGLSGAVHGLAFNNTTNFPAIVSPNFPDINGINNLKDLADKLAAFQGAEGEWGISQTTAYAVMALVEADPLVASDYSTEIADGRDWLRSVQLPNGGFGRNRTDATENTEAEGECLTALIPDPCTVDCLEFVLATGSDCVKPTQTVTVELWQRGLDQNVRGFQAFGQFDSSVMTHVSTTFETCPGTCPPQLLAPYNLVIRNLVSGDNIDLAAGIDDFNGQTPTMADALLVTLDFTASSTQGPTTVSFRYHQPPSRFTDENGAEVVPCLVESPTIIIDGTAPVFDQACPLPPINVNADAGTCEAAGTTVSPATATATDNLDPSPTVDFLRSDGKTDLMDPYEKFHSPITITWTATDCADNSSTCQQVVTVSDKNELVVNVELSPVVASPLTRCITFELWSGGVHQHTVTEDLTFTSGSATAALVEVPCGSYDCITARDKLHTLQRTDVMFDAGTQYTAAFTIASGDELIGGNLNDDQWIDILDFGIFSWKYGTNPGADTLCGAGWDPLTNPHADITGDGWVLTGDFTFIGNNFLTSREADCDGTPGPRGDGPITRISVAELHKLGMSELAAGDLNNDGWLDEADIEAFILGVRPKTPVEGPGDGANQVDPTSVRPRP